jgi:NIMA (never in mitosis gene a)-related kinase 1/4/5
MEYADGGDLQSKLRECREEEERGWGFDEKFIWKVAYELLHGLKALHGNKIIHRDIKSANIFFVNGIAKLGDLNVSKVAEQGMAETQTGTPYYTAPEIWEGRKYGNKCDIWSLGVLLYEMCSLKMPFLGQDFPSLYRRVIEGKYEEIPEVYSEAMQNLVRMCLITEEEMRPAASELLETAILKGMEMSLSSFNAEEGEIKLLDPIKCPKVLRFLAVKLPKPRFD